MKLLLLLIFLLSSPIQASEFRLIDLDEVLIDYVNFFPKSYNPLINNNGLSNRELGKEFDLTISTTLIQYGYMRGLIHSLSDSFIDTHKDGQFREVGLNLELGIRIAPFLDIYYWHYSQHVLDIQTPWHFPVEDGIGIHLYLYSKDRKESIF